MSTEYIRATISDYFNSNFTSAEIDFENLTVIDLSTRTEPYVKLTLRLTTKEQISLNPAPRSRQRGAVQVDIYVKEGKGAQAGYKLADAVSDLFDKQNIGGIEFAVPYPLTPLEVKGWYRTTVRAPFYFDT